MPKKLRTNASHPRPSAVANVRLAYIAAHECAECGETYVRAHFHRHGKGSPLTLDLTVPDAMHLAGELAHVINDHLGMAEAA